MKKPTQSKAERIGEVLGLFGENAISRTQFEQMLIEQHITEEDIDNYCTQHGGWTPP